MIRLRATRKKCHAINWKRNLALIVCFQLITATENQKQILECVFTVSVKKTQIVCLTVSYVASNTWFEGLKTPLATVITETLISLPSTNAQLNGLEIGINFPLWCLKVIRQRCEIRCYKCRAMI